MGKRRNRKQRPQKDQEGSSTSGSCNGLQLGHTALLRSKDAEEFGGTFVTLTLGVGGCKTQHQVLGSSGQPGHRRTVLNKRLGKRELIFFFSIMF